MRRRALTASDLVFRLWKLDTCPVPFRVLDVQGNTARCMYSDPTVAKGRNATFVVALPVDDLLRAHRLGGLLPAGEKSTVASP